MGDSHGRAERGLDDGPVEPPLPLQKERSDGASQVLRLVSMPAEPLPVAGAWRTLFDGGSGEVLARLTNGDPLDVWPRCAKELARRRLVVHPERLLAAALARIALLAPGYRGRPAIEAWLEERVADALDALVADDLRAEIQGAPLSPDRQSDYAMFVEVFGVEPLAARRAAVVFNSRPIACRRAVFALAFEGRSIQEVVALGSGDETEVEGHLAATLAALTRLDPPDPALLLSWEGER
jgi:hypothetical protein